MPDERTDAMPAEGRSPGDATPVWIIDDDRSIRWVFEKALAREGIGFRTFASAREALERLADESPEVVVSDIRMPGPTGLEFMQAGHKDFCQMALVVLFAQGDCLVDLSLSKAFGHGGGEKSGLFASRPVNKPSFDHHAYGIGGEDEKKDYHTLGHPAH